MSSISATCSIAARDVQPPDCSWARHRIGITAEACRPSGYLAISRFAQARFSGVKAKLAGCSSGGARRRTDIRGGLAYGRAALRSSPVGLRVVRPDQISDRDLDARRVQDYVAVPPDVDGPLTLAVPLVMRDRTLLRQYDEIVVNARHREVFDELVAEIVSFRRWRNNVKHDEGRSENCRFGVLFRAPPISNRSIRNSCSAVVNHHTGAVRQDSARHPSCFHRRIEGLGRLKFHQTVAVALWRHRYDLAIDQLIAVFSRLPLGPREELIHVHPDVRNDGHAHRSTSPNT